MATQDRTIRWIENLASQELQLTSGEVATIDLSLTKEDVLVGETVGFVRDIIYHVEYLVRLFNGRVNRGDLQIKFVRPAQKACEMFLLRHDRKLSIFTPQPGKVQFQCVKLLDDSRSSVLFTGMVEARFGIFHDVEWFFLRNRVSAEQVARHYLTEFIQVSRRVIES